VVILGRKPRVEYSGGIYHVIQRGNNREYIFEEKRGVTVPGT
jgi:REP element-mobilizing transposase RayT